MRAPRSGRVREVLAVVNTQVDVGAPLLRLDRPVGETTVSDAPPVPFEAPNSSDLPDASTQARQYLETLRAMITGYDVSAARALTLVAAYSKLRAELTETTPS